MELNFFTLNEAINKKLAEPAVFTESKHKKLANLALELLVLYYNWIG